MDGQAPPPREGIDEQHRARRRRGEEWYIRRDKDKRQQTNEGPRHRIYRETIFYWLDLITSVVSKTLHPPFEMMVEHCRMTRNQRPALSEKNGRRMVDLCERERNKGSKQMKVLAIGSGEKLPYIDQRVAPRLGMELKDEELLLRHQIVTLYVMFEVVEPPEPTHPSSAQ
jgi:hypothetical protein